MNILFISNLTGNLFAGPNNSVPAQITAQSKIDNVFWYNINHNRRTEWVDLHCYTLDDFPTGRLSDLPEPFNHPDIVVVEEFYCYPFSKIIYDIQKASIPYIIIPRSELTQKAQKKNRFKKIIGNILYFKAFAKKAAAIMYLSEKEQEESCKQWRNKSFIIPNGTQHRDYCKKEYMSSRINAVYIGRYEKYQKGLDLLINSIVETQELLRKVGFVLTMYGVNQGNTVQYLESEINQNGISDLISINDCVYGAEKDEVLTKADVFVLTSRFEGMPMGLIEALAYGLPAIATTGTNMAEEISQYKAGWTSDNSETGVINAIKQMIDAKEKGEFEIYSRAAYTMAMSYSWDNIAKQTHIRLESIINGNKV